VHTVKSCPARVERIDMKKGSNVGIQGSSHKKQAKKKKKGGVQWDEQNLEENERIKLELDPTKIDEPKTPYHPSKDENLSDDESLEMSPLSLSDDVGVQGTRSGGRRSMFEEHLEQEIEYSIDEEEGTEKRRKFLEARKEHYKVGRHLLSHKSKDDDKAVQ
jgi:hypothetical protein